MKSKAVYRKVVGILLIQCAPLNKAMFKRPLLVLQSKVLGTDFFISFCVQNTPGYKATLPVLASGYTIHSDTIFLRKRYEFS